MDGERYKKIGESRYQNQIRIQKGVEVLQNVSSDINIIFYNFLIVNSFYEKISFFFRKKQKIRR